MEASKRWYFITEPWFLFLIPQHWVQAQGSPLTLGKTAGLELPWVTFDSHSTGGGVHAFTEMYSGNLENNVTPGKLQGCSFLGDPHFWRSRILPPQVGWEEGEVGDQPRVQNLASVHKCPGVWGADLSLVVMQLSWNCGHKCTCPYQLHRNVWMAPVGVYNFFHCTEILAQRQTS